MVMIVKQENPWAPFAQGLAQGLERYGQQYQQNRQKSNFIKALEATGNYTPAEARLIAQSPEKIGKELIKMGNTSRDIAEENALLSPESFQQPTQAPQQRPIADLMQPAPQAPSQREELTSQLGLLAQQQRQNLLNRMVGEQQPQFGQPQFGSQMQGLQGLMGGMQGVPQAMGPSIVPQEVKDQYASSLMQPQEMPQVPRDMGQVAQPSQDQVAPGQDQVASPSEVEKPEATFNDLAKGMEDQASRYRKAAALATSKGATERAKGYREEAKALEDKAENYRKQEERKDKYNTDYIKEITTTARSAKEQNQVVQQQLELQRKGLLPSMSNELLASAVGRLSPGLKEFLQKSPGAEFFNKLGASQLKGLRSMFGSRITEREMTFFMKQFPSLSMTPEGRELMGDFFNLAEQKATLRSEIMRNNLKDATIDKYDVQDVTEVEFQQRMKELPGQAELDARIKSLYDKSPEGRREAAKKAKEEGAKVAPGTDMGSAKGWPEGTIIPGKGGKPDLISKGGKWLTV